MTLVMQLTDRIQILEKNVGEFSVKCAIIKGDTWTAVWDTLPAPEDMAEVPDLISGQNTIVIYSHADWDHVWGTSALTGRYNFIVAHHFCRDRFLAELPAELEEFQKNDPGKWDKVRLLPPDMTFSKSSELDLGGLTLELRHAPGHTRDSISCYIVEEGILLTGDAVENPFPSLFDRESVDEWIENLEMLANLPGLKQVVPSHGAPGGIELIHENITYLKNIKQGYDTEDASTLTDFYSKVHSRNLGICGY